VVRTSNAWVPTYPPTSASCDGTPFAGALVRVSRTPSRVRFVPLAEANGNYGITWFEGASTAVQFVWTLPADGVTFG